MPNYQYLQLQPVDDDDSALNDFPQDETIDLTQDDDEETLDREWARVMSSLKSDIDDTSSDAA